MPVRRAGLRRAAALFVAALLLPLCALAQDGPKAPVRLLVGFAPGGSSDLAARIIADNAVLNGFTIQGSTMSDRCTIAGIWMNPGSNAADVGGAWILYDIVQANIAGIELDSFCTARQTLVQYNLIQNNNNPGPGAGNGIETSFGLCNAKIDSNKFSGHISSSESVQAASSSLAFTNNELVAGTAEGVKRSTAALIIRTFSRLLGSSSGAIPA